MKHLSGERTLKEKCVDQNSLDQKKESIKLGKETKIQMKFKQLNNGHIMSQLRQIGIIQQNLKHQNELKIMKEQQAEQKSVASTANKVVVGRELSPGQKKSLQLKNPPPQLSAKLSKLQPSSCPGAGPSSKSFQVYQKLTETLSENALLSGKQLDDQKASFPAANQSSSQTDCKESSSVTHLNNSNLLLGNLAQEASTRKKKTVVQNKLAAMNGQIILNLNQIFLKNANKQRVLDQELKFSPRKQNRNHQVHNYLSGGKVAVSSSVPAQGLQRFNRNLVSNNDLLQLDPSADKLANYANSVSTSPQKTIKSPLHYNGDAQLRNKLILELDNNDSAVNIDYTLSEKIKGQKRGRIQLNDLKRRKEQECGIYQSYDNHKAIQFSEESPAHFKVLKSKRTDQKLDSLFPSAKQVLVETGKKLSRGTHLTNTQEELN